MSSIATRYRPKTIAEVQGQAALERVLSAAISQNRIASAYILTGIRGVGKTTTARIIARSLNCDGGPTLTPCGKCKSCLEIDQDNSLDVVEIDAASNTQVEKMRQLVENVSYAPMTRGKFRIYIIDEVHMLSNASFNALLKTLEEPPAHAIFILATTELRKIPATVQSRCQVLSLARIGIDTISANIDRIAGLEGAKLEAGVAGLVARAAEGSMRDALSMLDQAISGATGTVRLDDVSAMIGRASRLRVGRFAQDVIAGDVAASLTGWRAMIADGADPVHTLDDLADWFHQANLEILSKGLPASLGLPEGEVAQVGRIASATSSPALSGAITLLMDRVPVLRQGTNALQAAEVLLVRIVSTFARLRASSK